MNSELWRVLLKGKPRAQVLRRLSTGSGNGCGLCVGLELVGGSREEGNLRVN